MDKNNLLIEIGTEELPPRALSNLSTAFKAGIEKELKAKKLNFKEITPFATPRRLALHISDLDARQEDFTQTRRGPALASALKDGEPTPALLGFARSCGVEWDQLTLEESEKGAWYTYSQEVIGERLADLLPEMVESALKGLPIPKRMRWADNEFEFVRPVRWIVALYGEEVIPFNLFNIESGRTTRGHRFHAKEPIVLENADQYQTRLESEGSVLVDIEARKARIKAQIAEAVKPYGEAIVNEGLLNEVTALVEWPVTHIGSFEEHFLEVPQEALIIAMEEHQRYFPIVDKSGNLINKFCFVSNIESNEPEAVIDGNERVIRPRFADAKFFWEEDLKKNLESYLEPLSSVIFQTKLGTQAEKIARVTHLADLIADSIGADRTLVARAARLNKSDLISNMVQEFPELQGTMARYYALAQKEDEVVANALEEVYWPRFAGDKLPQTKEAQALSIAERLDTIVGIFSIGEIPTGSRDPYSLRRNALAILRILIEEKHHLDLHRLITASAQSMPKEIDAEKSIPLIFNYIIERMRAYSADLGVPADIFESISEQKLNDPLDIYTRLQAVTRFKDAPEAQLLVQSDRRIRHILERNLKDETVSEVDPNLFENDSEKVLFEAINRVSEESRASVENDDYDATLRALSTLADPLESFFEKTMVVAEEEALRLNRFALLKRAGDLLQSVADISKLQLG